MVDWLAGKRIKGTSTERTTTAGIGTGVGGWVELGRTTTGSALSDFSVGSLANKRYYMILTNIKGKSNSGVNWQTRMGNGTIDTSYSYSMRYSLDGGAVDDAGVNAQQIQSGTNPTSLPQFEVGYIANFSTKEKLFMAHDVNQNTAGAGTAPQRGEYTGKYTLTSNPINIIGATTSSAHTMSTGSEMVVLGWDPADTHTNNFWTELDSVNASGSPSTLNTNTFTAKKYLWIQIYAKNNNGANYADWRIRFNGDTGNNYAMRQSYNGGSDTTYTSATPINYFGSYLEATGSTLMNMFIINNSSNEKLAIIHTSGFSNAQSGAGFAPNRQEAVIKWTNISSQITSMQIYRDSGSGTFGNESIIKVWGSD